MKRVIYFLTCISLSGGATATQHILKVWNLRPPTNKFMPKVVVRSKALRSGDAFHFFYQNQFDDLVTIHKYKKVDRTYYMTIFTDRPILLYHGWGLAFWPVFAIPGDTITIAINKRKDGYNYISTQYGKSANILNMVNDRYGNLSITSPLFNPRINFHYYDSVYDQLLENENRTIDSLCEVYNTDPKYKNYIKKEMFYYDIEIKLEPYYYTKQYDLNIIPKWYMAKLNTFKRWINKDDNINLKHYRFFCYRYNMFLIRDSLYSYKFPFYEYDNAKKTFTKKTRDNILFKIIQKNINKGIPGFEKCISEFQSDCKDAAYKEYIDSLYSRFYGLIDADSVLSSKLFSTDGQALTWKNILAKNKGKVMYVDFWASWCGPCIAEMPGSIALQSELNNKNISFVYISIDDYKDNWLKAISDHHLRNAGQHYLLNDQRNSPIEKILGIPPIPHYVLLNKDGKTIAIDAYRPHDPRIEAMMNDLLKE